MAKGKLSGACLIPIAERDYKEKYCKTCGKKFKPTQPATTCCSEECRTEKRLKYNRETAHAAYLKKKQNRPQKKCKLCGKPLEHSNGMAHKKCMLYEFLTNYGTLKKDRSNVVFMRNHFSTTNPVLLLEIAHEIYGMDIDFEYKPEWMNARPIKCVETGETFLSINQAAKKHFISSTSISNVLAGKAPTAGGYHWEALTNDKKM